MKVIIAGGGTGGHVIPALAVAQELRRHGHEPIFIGTRRGYEARLVPAAGFTIEWIAAGGFNRVSWAQRLRSLWQLPISLLRVLVIFLRRRPRAVFSMGGYVAVPVTVTAALLGVPIVLMEPNAVPGLANRRIGRFVRRALINFPETADYFPSGISEATGVPVREEFFPIQPANNSRFTLLVTGGSQGSRTLNQALRASWPLFANVRDRVRFIHQTGPAMHAELAGEFSRTGLDGEVTPFISDMPAAFSQADLIVSRAGASTVSEIAAAGRPAVLVPFPYAADNHQLRNAEAFARTGAGIVIEDAQFTGERLFDEVSRLMRDRERLSAMGASARSFAKPGAAARAAEIMEEIGGAR
ncbi:MAG TPA: undecaprenyldiphospho-muramoylpentapeptide beta-N-acetylglucosaminyltransferase [Bryobacteraceae bacterium]|nr:undecaprenyldiphospho-muramoylpentapeptide beta-N-acetylglucosaminyltransferase [Bryobacteraceae bacterium]